MAVYKKGYVCWCSKKFFPTYKERKGFKLKNGMVIKLEHFKKEYEEYLRENHASFTTYWFLRRKSFGVVDSAIRSEVQIDEQVASERRGSAKERFIGFMTTLTPGSHSINEFRRANTDIGVPRLRDLIQDACCRCSEIRRAMRASGVVVKVESWELEDVYFTKR